jgi:hypothetical protein
MPDVYDSIKIIYIAGTGRNGSTLIGNILAEVPDVISIGELRYLWRDLYFKHQCGCGREINSCDFWSECIREAFGSLSKSDLQSLVFSTEKLTRRFGVSRREDEGQARSKSDPAELVKAFEAVYKAVRVVSNRKVVVDSSKTPLFEKFIISRLPYPVYTVHLIRDPRATSYSWTTRKNTLDPAEPFLPQFNVFSTAFGWMTWNIVVEMNKNKNYFRLLYEKWADKPQDSVEEIMRFADVIPPRAPLFSGRTIELNEHHTVSGNPVRFIKGRLEVKADERWRRSMPFHQQLLVLAETWPLFIKYYYFKRKN